MKYVFIICVLFGILLQCSSRLLILITFQANREYIAKNLCVQKKVKNNCCQGSCQLKKELSKEDKKEQAPGHSSENKNETQLICQAIDLSSQIHRHYEIISFITCSEAKPVFQYSSIFHPPC